MYNRPARVLSCRPRHGNLTVRMTNVVQYQKLPNFQERVTVMSCSAGLGFALTVAAAFLLVSTKNWRVGRDNGTEQG